MRAYTTDPSGTYQIEYQEEVPDTKSTSSSFNFGFTVKPWDKRRWAAGMSFTIPMSNSMEDKTKEPKGSVAIGVSYSF